MDKRPAILIVDDNEEILMLLSDALAPFYSVEITRDGSAVLSRLQQEHFDLLLLDLGLPDLDGEQVIRQVRSHPRLYSLPIIVISAYRDLRERMRRSQVDAFLAKPFSMDELFAALHTLLGNMREMP